MTPSSVGWRTDAAQTTLYGDRVGPCAPPIQTGNMAIIARCFLANKKEFPCLLTFFPPFLLFPLPGA